MSDDDRKFQRELAYDQIMFGGLITIGATLLTVAFAFWLFALTVLDDMNQGETSIVNIDGVNQLILFLGIAGGLLVLSGLFLPALRFRQKKDK